MSQNCRPVGFFDSGVGGISVLKAAYQLMSEENYIYYGDNFNAPYGTSLRIRSRSCLWLRESISLIKALKRS